MDEKKINRYFHIESTNAELEEVLKWSLNPKNDFVKKRWMKENWDFICSVDKGTLASISDESFICFNIQKKIHECSPALKINVDNPLSNKQIKPIKSLLAAEAAFLMGDNVSTSTYINVLRKRAERTEAQFVGRMMVTPSQVNADFTLNERGRVLDGQCHQWNNLKRLDKLTERITVN